VAIERVLVVGSGGREHALAWRISRDPGAPRVWAAPGNDGVAGVATRVPARELDSYALLSACRENAIDLAVIGPEAPLAAGVADAMRAGGVRVFGPSREAARVESSKWFAKEIMTRAGIPTARAESFTGVAEAHAALGRYGPPWVVKADGLAAGKGVLVTRDRMAAEAFVIGCLGGEAFGESGRRVVLEEFLEGEEASVMAVCDGRRALVLPAARDYKRARDGDLGPNTGGMGAFAPTPAVDAALETVVSERIVDPLLETLDRSGTPYRGLLYVGLMLTADGPRVIEFNARFGDPETQVVLPLVGGSLADLLASAADGTLNPSAVTREKGSAVAVALVDEGYPEAPRGGGEIAGLEALSSSDDTWVFHAGIAREGRAWRVRGGRAAYVVARADRADAARARAYAAIGRLGGTGWRCRADIGLAAGGIAARTAGAGA
jgi:phosphoribosylamine--glycine ligase